jgi:HEAT repeats/HEAT repeat
MNWRCFFQLSLLSVLATGLWPDFAAATKASAPTAPASKAATKAPAKAPVVAPNPTPAPNHLPWLLGGGAVVLAGVGGAGVYRLGRSSGQQAARVDQAVSQYRTLGELAPALPSSLEEELYGLKSAQPQLADQSSPQEIAAEQAAFATELHEFDAAQLFNLDQSVDAAQLDAAFADLADLTEQPAAQLVLPIAPSPSISPPPITHPPIPVQTTVVWPSMPTEKAIAPTPDRPAIARSEREPLPPTPVTASAIVVGDAPDRATRVDGELMTATTTTIVTDRPGIGLARQTRLPQVGAVENLLKEIQNPDPTKRRKAIWDLGQWGDTRAVQPLVDLMIEADSKQRSLILSALSEIGTRTIKPMSKALAISLQDDNADVRKNAIRDLTRIYDLVAQVSQMVQKCAVDDPEAEVRETAAWALKQLNRIRPVSLDHSLALSGAVSPPESLPAK